jgi:oxaloacetate decarboxylase beta subunit
MSFLESISKFLLTMGFAGFTWQQSVMLLVACVLIYLALRKGFEPLLLVPIGFGMLLGNLPLAGLMDPPVYQMVVNPQTGEHAHELKELGGLIYYIYQGVKLGIYPPLIFLGVGAMTDFGPLIANPKSILLGAAAQFGIFTTFLGALLLDFIPGLTFTVQEAASIGIIGGADGPTAIFLTARLAPHLLGPIAVAAYSYMALVPMIQPPIMKALTTRKEREVVMEQLRPVSQTEKIVFPILVAALVSLILPAAAPLVGMLMLGNLFRETVAMQPILYRLLNTAQNELINIVTILLGVSVGATANGMLFLQPKTLGIVCLGLIAFCVGTAAGVIFGKIMYRVTGGKVNPLIGSAGVSAVPMAARVSQIVGQQYNPSNFLLMHAMGPNVAGVIGSAVAAGVLLSMLG